MTRKNCPSCFVLPIVLLATLACVATEDYNLQHNDGSYEFGYENPDSYHHRKANNRNVVRGEFGGRNPKTGRIDVTHYTAGPRGYRPRGKNIARKYDLSQVRRGPIGSRDDPYFDPNEDPSYDFAFKTRTYQRQESANRVGDVTGKYSYLDDVGERHNVEFIAGKNTGFHVKTPFPDSNPRAYGPLFVNGRGRPLPRGRTSIQRGLDGSYRFVAAGPDQRRTETSDAQGNIRGSYTYLDDKGVQHSVHYIAGPNIGYRVLKNVKGPHLPSVFPFTGPNIVPPDFYNYIDRNSQGDVFNAHESGGAGGGGDDYGGAYDDDGYVGRPRPNRPRPKPSGAVPRPRPSGSTFGDKPILGKPSYDDDDGLDAGDDDLFGGGTGIGVGSTTSRPSSGSGRPSAGGFSDDGSTGGNAAGSGSGGGGGGGVGSSTGDGDTGIGEDDDGGAGDGDYDDSDLFGGPPSGGRPKPTSSGGAGRPSTGSGGLSGGSSRPGGGGLSGGSSRPGGGGLSGGSSRPGSTSSTSGGRPRPNQRPPTGSRPGARPSYGDEEDDADLNVLDEGLFGPAGTPGSESGTSTGLGGSSTSTTYDGSTSKPPLITIADSGGHKTVVTNLGDKVFTVPPGVSVHAHVQSIDLYPYESKVPSPADQFRAETTQTFQRLTTRQVSKSDTKSISDTPSVETTTMKHNSGESESLEEDFSTTTESSTLPPPTKSTSKPPIIK